MNNEVGQKEIITDLGVDKKQGQVLIPAEVLKRTHCLGV